MKELVLKLVRLFDPLTAITSAGSLGAFLAEFGWATPAAGNQAAAIEALSLDGEVARLQELAAEIAEEGADSDRWPELATLVTQLARAITRLNIPAGIFPFDSAEFRATFARDLLEYLVSVFFERHLPQLFGVLSLIGVFSRQFVPNAPGRFPFWRRTVDWARLVNAVTQPVASLKNLYGWDRAPAVFEHNLLIENLVRLAKSLGVRAIVVPPTEGLFDRFFDVEHPSRGQIACARVRLVSYVRATELATTTGSIDLVMLPIPPEGNRLGEPVGVMIGFDALAEAAAEFTLRPNVTLVVGGSLGSEAAARVELRPNDSKVVVDPSLPNLDTSLGLFYRPPQALLLLGSPNGSRLEFREAGFQVDVGVRQGQYEVESEFGIKGGRLVIVGGDGDGFIQKILPRNPIIINWDLFFGFDRARDVYLKGAVGLELIVPIDCQVGPILINTIKLTLRVEEGRVSVVAAVTAGATVGPLSVVVQEVGIRLNLEPGAEGAFGNADLTFRFKPPSGMGCGINTQGFRGGGFLSIDPPNYAGILNVAYQDTFDITIIGLVTTRLPGNRRGFSMVLSILARFQPIQLGMGIALEGVGGLIGIHRSLNEPGLRRVYLEHRLDAVLFPDDPIRDAPIILDAIGDIFPPTENYHTFALLALLTWGASAKLVEGRLGIAIEIGGPLRMALMGHIRSELPNAESPVLVLRMDILGFMDAGRQILTIDSTIYNSTLLQEFELSGDSAIRIDWSDESSDALLSVGGFYPGYKPTIPVPKLKRMTISLGSDIGEMSATSYFAVCSNSIQSGAALRIDCAWGSVSIRGGSGYDVLVKYSPFSFEASCYAWVKVGYGGTNVASVDLRFSLTGPNPFHAQGYAAVELFLLSFDVDFEARFGRKKHEEIPVVSPYADLLAQVRDPRNLRMELPPTQMRDVVFEPSTQEENLLDPGGAIVFSQRAMPLEFLMEKYGGGKPPKDESYLSVRFVGDDASGDAAAVKAKFAPGPYKEWSDKQKLSAPPFQMLTSGRTWTAAPAAPSAIAMAGRDFETLLREEGSNHFVTCEPIEPDEEVRRGLALGDGRRRFDKDVALKNPAHRNYVTVSEPEFTVVRQEGTANGAFARTVVDAAPVGNMSHTEAQDTAIVGGHSDAVVMDVAFAQAV